MGDATPMYEHSVRDQESGEAAFWSDDIHPNASAPSNSTVGSRFDDLEALGYTLNPVAGGAEALRTIRQPMEHVHLHIYEGSVDSAARAPKQRRSRSVTDDASRVLPEIRTRASSRVDHRSSIADDSRYNPSFGSVREPGVQKWCAPQSAHAMCNGATVV